MEKLTFENFQQKWMEQETGNDEQLEFEISESSDWSEIFSVIRMWSHKPLKERIKVFLERNNSFLDDEGKVVLETF